MVWSSRQAEIRFELGQIGEQMLVETFVPQTAIEAFHEAVLRAPLRTD